MSEPATFFLGLFLYAVIPLALFLSPFAIALLTTRLALKRRGLRPTWRSNLGSLFATALLLGLLHVTTLDGLDGLIFGVFTPDDTIWAPSYSSVGFLRVRRGMSMSQVESLVGQPLDRYVASTTPPLVGWRWSRSARSNNYYCRVVLFKDGRVAEKHSEFYLD